MIFRSSCLAWAPDQQRIPVLEVRARLPPRAMTGHRVWFVSAWDVLVASERQRRIYFSLLFGLGSMEFEFAIGAGNCLAH